MKYNVNKEQRNLIVRQMLTEGKTTDQIAEEFKVTPNGVRYWIKLLGLVPNPKIKPFTEQEQFEILRLHDIPTDAVAIAKQVGTTQSRVLHFLKKNGKDTSCIRFNKSTEVGILQDYYNGFTQDELVIKYGAERQCINNILVKQNVQKRTKREVKQNSWYVWEDGFKDMTCEKALFFYGLLTTDGCITGKKENSVVISLQHRDAPILEELRKYLRVEKPLVISPPRNERCQAVATFRVQDDLLVNRLKTLGLAPRKSCKETVPNCEMTDEQARHFWRGCIAGDGSVKNYDNSPFIHLCGSKELCTQFSLFIQRVAGLKNPPKVSEAKDKNPDKKVGLHYTKVTGSKAKDLGDFLFKDSSINMERKYAEYLKFSEYKPAFVWLKDRVQN
jgi:hypothetical protein